MENKKQVFLSLETAKEMYKSSDKAIKQFALDNFTKEELEAKELPKTWSELDKDLIKNGYFVNNYHVGKVTNPSYNFQLYGKYIFPTKELAEASLALSQLLQLRDVYNGDWKVDLNNRPNETKYFINNSYNRVNRGRSDTGWNYVLSFKSEAIQNQFFNNFTGLLETALPLL